MPSPRIAIIGAGMAGLTLATLLRDSPDMQVDVLVVDKARGVGGRMASRRVEGLQFDHGAQYWTARSKQFRRFLQPWCAAGIVQVWEPRVLTLAAQAKPYRRNWYEPHYVGVPAMTALPKALASTLRVKQPFEVSAVERRDNHWWLHATDGSSEGPFDWVVSTAPAPQSMTWLPADFSGMAALQTVSYAPCFALMLGYAEPLALRWDAARLKASAIDWIVKGNTRPGLATQPSLLLHSTHDWASQHLNDDSDSIIAALLHALDTMLDLPLPALLHTSLHRWRYAKVVQTTQSPFELDQAQQLAACGDWSVFSHADNGGARVEAAFLSGAALAEQLLVLLKR